MPLQILDIALAAIMIISGLLALMRGFTREVLSLLAWAAAALAAWWAINNEELVALAQQYIQQEKVAVIAAGGAVFLIVLVIMSLVSVKLGDLVLDSAVGPFDRTLGFFYGLVRGLLLVVIVYMFYIWLVPREKQEDWVRTARSLPVIESVAGIVVSFLPPDIREVIEGKLASGRMGGTDAMPDGATGKEPAYRRGDKTRLDSLIESQQNKAPAGAQ